MKDIQIHPFDLTYGQIKKHSNLYKCPKGCLKNAHHIPKTTLEQVFLNLSKSIILHPDAWRAILKQFD